MFLTWFLVLHVTTGIFIAIILILFSANHNNFRSSDLEMSLEHFNSPITIDFMRVYTYSRSKWFNRESFIVIGVFMESWITPRLRFENGSFVGYIRFSPIHFSINIEIIAYILRSNICVTYMHDVKDIVRYHENFWICVDMLFIFFGYSVTSSLICFCW